MKLFEFKNWELTVREEAWGLAPFANILKRDKTKDKTKALKEMLYIWHFCDIKSDYQYISDEDERSEAIRKDLNLPASWKHDKVIKEAVECYRKHSVTIIQKLYMNSLISAQEIGNYLANTKALLAERDAHGKVVTDIAKITSSVQKVPKLMADLKAAYKEVVKEQEDMDNRQKGSRKMNMFEDGLEF